MTDSKVKILDELRPWQKTILRTIENGGNHRINVMVDFKGNTGKATFCKWMDDNQKAQIIPPMRKTKDVCRVVYQKEKKGAYLCKIPCAMQDAPLEGLWEGLEITSDGFCFDYRGKSGLFDIPVVWVFVRSIPLVTKLYKHKFVFWRLQDESDPEHSELVKFIPDSDVIESRAKIYKKKN